MRRELKMYFLLQSKFRNLYSRKAKLRVKFIESISVSVKCCEPSLARGAITVEVFLASKVVF